MKAKAGDNVVTCKSHEGYEKPSDVITPYRILRVGLGIYRLESGSSIQEILSGIYSGIIIYHIHVSGAHFDGAWWCWWCFVSSISTL